MIMRSRPEPAVRDNIVSGDAGGVCHYDENTSIGESKYEKSSENDNRRAVFKFLLYHRRYIDEYTYKMHAMRFKGDDDELHGA